MPADLRVSAISLPSPLHAPCPTVVVVTVVKDGDEPPLYGRQRSFDVSVDVTGSVEVPFTARFTERVADSERSNLQPGQSIDVTVNVS